jgi:(p)ppGpp synthase/HD superfamily hydrolase
MLNARELPPLDPLGALAHLEDLDTLGAWWRGVRVRDAAYFMIGAHGEQRRKWTNEPYAVHPLRVMRMVDLWLLNDHFTAQREDVLVAALLHDVLEDTDTTGQQIQQHFGPRVLAYVEGLTDRAKGVRAERARANAERIARQPPWVQAIKCADIADNVPSVRRHDPDFARVYVREKLDALPLFVDAPSVAIGTAFRACVGPLDP